MVRVRQRAFTYCLLRGQLSLSGRTRCGLFSVHRMSTNVHRLRGEGVACADRALAALAGEVPVIAIDHVNSLASLNSWEVPQWPDASARSEHSQTALRPVWSPILCAG